VDRTGQRGDPALSAAIGILGGTFDPVHIGHLRTAVELKEHLGLSTVRLMPCGNPPHRDTPMTPAEQRLAMVRLAIAGEPGLEADDREVRHRELSYTLNTLMALRGEVGENTPLCFCVGMDSLVQLASWHRWREITDYCHLVVAARPGWELPRDGEVAQWLAQHQTRHIADLHAQPAGFVFVEAMTLLPVSASQLREHLAQGGSIRYLTPDSVVDYIECQGLYR
jgi:nicotinate-nucleotide adenylyltransferase